MKSLKRRYNNIAQLNHYWSSYICFAEAVKRRGFSKRVISHYFNELVETDDYNKADKGQIIKHLIYLSAKNKT